MEAGRERREGVLQGGAPESFHRARRFRWRHLHGADVPFARGQAASGGYVLRSWTVDALPILDDFLRRMRLEEFLATFLPPHDRRTKVPAAGVLAVLVKNLLLSREPLYGLGAWVAGCDPTFLGLSPEQALAWNDDRAGRGLFGRFHADRPDGPATDRPVRVRAAAHADTSPASCRGHGHRTHTPSTPAPQTAGAIRPRLRRLTCRREIRRKGRPECGQWDPNVVPKK